VKRFFICRLSGCQKKCALPKPFEPMIIIDFSLVFPSRQCEFACPVSSFLVGCTVSSGETCLQNMDFSYCSARGGIEPPLLAQRRFTSRGCSPELRTMRKG
jgi:hypothetical protein